MISRGLASECQWKLKWSLWHGSHHVITDNNLSWCFVIRYHNMTLFELQIWNLLPFQWQELRLFISKLLQTCTRHHWVTRRDDVITYIYIIFISRQVYGQNEKQMVNNCKQYDCVSEYNETNPYNYENYQVNIHDNLFL